MPQSALLLFLLIVFLVFGKNAVLAVILAIVIIPTLIFGFVMLIRLMNR